jgi:nitrate reductase gamma subunit
MEQGMYEFARGPLVWLAFSVFIGGSLYKLISLGRLAKKEKHVLPTMSARFGIRSLLHWIIPMGSTNMKMHPYLTTISFVFHLCLLVTPLFIMGHAVLWQESWGVSWWSLPPLAADIMTLAVILAVLFFVTRRLAAPEVRNVTSWKDFAIAFIVVSPFITGLAAHQQWLDYRTTVVAHIVCGTLWLIAIPFSRLSHMFWFVFTRAYMGSEFGAVRKAKDW